jgi:predicted small metal-binding protein
MLLIDGVKYELWTPEGDKAEEELEQMVKEHASEIFGEGSIYVDIKHKLKSKAGTGTIPDGYVITFGDNPQLHIVEVELFNHSYDHIISQITKIITCLKDLNTWNDIARTIRDEINKDEFTAIKAKRAIKSGEVYEFLYDRISNLASLVIVIDKDRPDVREGIGNITHREIKMIEFQTFKRAGAETVHVHLFQPLYKIAEQKSERVSETRETKTRAQREEYIISEIKVKITPASIKYGYIPFPKEYRHLFPGYDQSFILITDIGEIITHVTGAPTGTVVGELDAGNRVQTNLMPWYKKHRELQIGNEVSIKTIEPMKKYRLEILK